MRLSLFTILLSLFFIVGCQNRPLDVLSHAQDLDFSQYKTIKVETLNDLKLRPIQFINKSITSHLQAKGYALSDKPDLIVVYQINVDNKTLLKQQQVPIHNLVYNKTQLEAVREAKILVNAYDPKTEQVVWKASTSRDITQVNPDQVNQSRIDDRINQLFDSFPAN